MSADYPDHDWRTEQYGTIRGKFYAVVNFAWCEPTGAPSWRWHVGRVEDCEMVADGYNYATAAEARAAADKWVAEYADGAALEEVACPVGMAVDAVVEASDNVNRSPPNE